MNEPAETATADESDLARVRRFFERRGYVNSCPVCQQTRWTVLQADGLMPAVMVLQKDGGLSIPPPSVPTYTIICDTCGYMRSFARYVVDMALNSPEGSPS